jgi:hypothetical protein
MTCMTARVHHIEGNPTDIQSCHHVGFPLAIDTIALNMTLSVSETRSDEPQCQTINGWLKVGNGGVGAVSSACAVPVCSWQVS